MTTYNEYGPSAEDMYVAIMVPNSISSVACVLSLVLFIWIIRSYPSLANRVSFRLALCITIGDIIYSVTMLVPAFYLSDSDNVGCTTIMVIYVASLLFSVLATAAIASNLFILFIFGAQWKIHEQAYYVGLVMLSTGIPMVGLGLNKLGYNGIECWFKGDSPGDLMAAEWGLMYIWVAGSAFFCTFVALYIWYQLLRSSQLPLQLTFSSNLSHRADNQSAASSHHARDDVTIRKSVARISVYCVTPIICQFFMMALDVALYVDREQQWWFMNYMLFLAYLFSGLQGTINSTIFFFLDPAPVYLRTEWARTLMGKHCIPYILLPDPPSRNRYSLAKASVADDHEEEDDVEINAPKKADDHDHEQGKPVSKLDYHPLHPPFKPKHRPQGIRKRIAFWVIWVLFARRDRLEYFAEMQGLDKAGQDTTRISAQKPPTRRGAFVMALL